MKRALLLLAVLALGFSACKKDDDDTSSGGGGTSYAGTWAVTTQSTSRPNTSCDPNTTGSMQSQGTVVVASNGSFTGSDFSGTVNSNGTFSGIINAQGSCSTQGSFSGSCSSATSCTGTYSFSGNSGNIFLAKQ